MTKRRVVITGMGAVTPCGIGVKNFWNSMKEGKSGISTIEQMPLEGHTVTIAGEIKDKDFNPDDYINPKEAKRMDRYTQFAIAAADEAIADSGIDEAGIDPYRIGVIVSSAAGGFKTFEQNHLKMINNGPTKGSPFTVPMLIVDMASGRISMNHGYKGVNKAVVSACATGTHSIGDAFRSIQYGDADVMVAGGTEASISQAAVAGFCSMKALCTDHNDDPAHASRPFDANRSGFIMGEGAGIIVMETLEHAEKRGAHIYAEIVGYGANSDAYHITSPAPHGAQAAKCMAKALEDAGLDPSEVDYINAHGTSTHLNDLTETEAIKTVWGEHAKDVSVSSIKSMTGHLLGAAGGIECIATALAVENDMLPPTINYETPDEGLDLDYVPNKAKAKTVRAALSNNLGFGGHNACIVLKKYSK